MAEQEHADLFMAMPMLRSESRLDPAPIQECVDSLEGVQDRGSVSMDRGIVSFSLDGLDITVSPMSAPVPWGDLEGPCRTSILWKNASEEVKGHKAHLIACASGEKPRQALAWYLTKGIEAVLPTVDAIGVYWGAAPLIVPKGLFLEMSKKSSLEFLPLYLWVDFRLHKHSTRGLTLFTSGLKSLGLMEIEIHNSDRQPAHLVDRAFNLAHYLLDNGPVINDGDTFGLSAGDRVRVRHARSAVDPGRKVYVMQP